MDCELELEPGCLPLQGGPLSEVVWRAGELEHATVLGVTVSAVRRDRSIPVRALRCPGCGLLRLYAREAAPQEPAQGS